MNNLTTNIYIFSGLGADERIFQRLDFSGFSTTYIKWVVPRNNETIEDYASRLLNQITTEKPTLIGVSFGGIMAIEVAKQIETQKVILISSCKTKREIPFYYRLAGSIGFHKLIPSKLLKSSNFVSNWFFGVNDTNEKQLLKQILIDTDPIFLSWAIDKIVKWSNNTSFINIFHIHGTNDRILPMNFINPNISIKNGGHLMTLNYSEKLNEILRQQLKE
jgi:pimeloyl-ACP methyl ester carboxylesterase